MTLAVVFGVGDSEVRQIVDELLSKIEEQVSYIPPKDDPLPQQDVHNDENITEEIRSILADIVEHVIAVHQLVGLRSISTEHSQQEEMEISSKITLVSEAEHNLIHEISAYRQYSATYIISHASSQTMEDEQEGQGISNATGQESGQPHVAIAPFVVDDEDPTKFLIDVNDTNEKEAEKLVKEAAGVDNHSSVSEGRNDVEADDDSRETENKKMTDEEVDEVYATLWLSRKKELEAKAEQRAKLTFQTWQRDRKSLEDIIENSLKEYIEIYEKAHALRLQFEAEKQQLMTKVTMMLASRTPATSSFFGIGQEYGDGLPFKYSFSDDEAEDARVGSKRKKEEEEDLGGHVAIVTPSRKKFTTPFKK